MDFTRVCGSIRGKANPSKGPIPASSAEMGGGDQEFEMPNDLKKMPSERQGRSTLPFLAVNRYGRNLI